MPASINLLVPDANEALAFFKQGLHYQVHADETGPDGRRWLLLRAALPGGAALLLSQPASDAQRAAVGRQAGDAALGIFHTTDFEADRARLRALGANFLETPRDEPYGRVVLFQDPWGNRWDLLQPAPPPLPPEAAAVLRFWFEEIQPAQWWKVDAGFDALVRERFGDLLRRAALGELADWRWGAEGRLAEVIVLDQFSRNIHRGTPQAFAQDPLALCLAQQAVALGLDQTLDPPHCSFLLMPFMHSESALVHAQAETLFERGAPDNLDFERRHRAIVERFGRYPHRNAILGRASTPEELEFLQQPGSHF